MVFAGGGGSGRKEWIEKIEKRERGEWGGGAFPHLYRGSLDGCLDARQTVSS